MNAKVAPASRTPRKIASLAAPWFVYLLKCSNGCLYTGIATDVQKRLAVHNAGKGSAYVRAHRPATLVAFTRCADRSAASVLEYAVKSLARSQKLILAKSWKAAHRNVRKPKSAPSRRSGGPKD